MRKKMLFGSDAREKLLRGAYEVYKAVGSSYSPRGRLTSIGRPWGYPILIADGVNIAREVGSEDLFVDQGIMVIVEAAKKQVEDAGDGTTVTTILSYELFNKGMDLLAEGINPAIIRKEVKAALPVVLNELEKLTTPISGIEDVRRVARISSTDDEIADVVTKAVEKIGKDGQITVEENKIPVTEVDYNDGMRIDKGYATPYFVTDSDRMETVLEDVLVVVLDKRITTQLEIKPLLEVLVQKGKNIFILGEVEGEALRMCVVNKARGVLNIVTVPPPSSGEKRKELVEDIAAVTGATPVKDELGMAENEFFAQFDQNWIGSAKTVVVDKNSTLIVRSEEKEAKDPAKKKELRERNKRISERIETVRKLRDETKSIYDREKYEERLAKLTTGVAVIKVGGKVGIDTREYLERVKDAVAAAKACQDGIVPGGGVAFAQMAKALENKKRNYGEQLLYEVLQEPTKKLLSNAGIEGEEQIKLIKEVQKKGGNFGYNVESEKIEDLIKTGVIDPAKVIRLALENAVAVGTKLLMTECVIVDAPEEKSNMQMI